MPTMRDTISRALSSRTQEPPLEELENDLRFDEESAKTVAVEGNDWKEETCNSTAKVEQLHVIDTAITK
jgi:hypothetical protein